MGNLFAHLFGLLSRRTTAIRSQRQRSCRQVKPRLEGLEERVVPTNYLVSLTTPDSATMAGTLRYALTNAHNGDSITFAGGLSGDTITLATMLTVSTNVTITGLGAANLAISGNNKVSVFSVNSGVTASIASLTVENGVGKNSTADGITNFGTLALSYDTISGCSDNSAVGVIANSGTMTSSHDTITGNSCVFSFSNNGSLTSSQDVITDNTAELCGGFFNGNDSSIALSNDSITSNTVLIGGAAGGICNGKGSTLTSTNDTISGNSDPGTGSGIVNYGTLTSINDTISGNSTGRSGGGILNNGTLTSSNDTISGNSAEHSGGGILAKSGLITLTNDTISGNSAGTVAGGVMVNRGSTLTLSNDTITGNIATSGSGITASGTVTLLNCIVAGNTASTDPDISGTISVAYDNLIGNTSGLTITTGTGNLYASTPGVTLGLVSSLAPNGGPTHTVALLPTSSAINNGGDITTLATAITSTTATSITVTNAAAIAQSTPVSITIWVGTEEMLVTAVNTTTNVLTVQRGVNGTTPGTPSTANIYLGTDQRGFTRPPTTTDIGAFQLQAVTASTAILPPSSTSITINGSAFDPTAANDSVSFDNGVTGSVTSATSTSLTVSLTGLTTVASGTALHASVTVDTVNSGPAVQVATVVIPLAISTTSLPNWTVNQAYNQTIATSGGAAPLNFTVSVGNLPTGLSLNTSTGAITGTPSTTTGSPFSFTIAVTDAVSELVSQNYTVAINAAPTITTTSLPSWTLNQVYTTQTIAVSGGTPSFSFTVSAGTFPAGLTLNTSTGAITGTPTTATSYSFTIMATDLAGATATHNYSITINAALTITTSTLATAYVATSYSQPIATSGGTSPLTYALTAGTLPAGLSLNSSTGAITGTPTTPTITNLVTFPYNSVNPRAGLIEDSHGNLFGTTFYGGVYNDGTVFELPAGNYSNPITLVTFSGTANGANPYGGLYIDPSGNIYGTTFYGGSIYNDGSVFELAANTYALTTLVSFNFNNGAEPQCTLVADSNGNLYGTTTAGGSGSDGTVFEITATTHTFSTLINFNGSNGFSPEGNLALDGSNNIYGTTYGSQFGSGADIDGTMFEVPASNHNSLTTFFAFSGTTGSHLGAYPVGGLLYDNSSGILYGTTSSGGTSGVGTLFQVAVSTHTQTTLVTFTGIANGATPEGALIEDGNHNLYGTAEAGGLNNGTVFEVAAGTHTLTTLLTFTGSANGANPYAGLVADNSGDLFGTTEDGGTATFGTVFELTPGSTSYTYNSLNTFTGPSSGTGATDSLIQDSNGDLFGTTKYGGTYNDGTVFEVAAGTHALTTLVNFNGNGNGAQPGGALYADSNGNLYGTTGYGGADNSGTVFEIAANTHLFSTLVTFTGTSGEGEVPECTLIADSSGNLYGTTYAGGSGYGTVFEVAATTHALTTLISFNGTNGQNPQAGLLLDNSGNLFGTTTGGDSGDGTVFELAANTDTLTTLATFTGGTNGATPEGGLVEDTNGDLFGTTAYGGTSGSQGEGTVFEVAAGTHTLTYLVTFTSPNGAYPEASLIADSNGNLFGTTVGSGEYSQGSYTDGTVFELAAGTHNFTTLATFTGSATGAGLYGGLLEDSSGNFYGITNVSGPLGGGTVFEVAAGGAVTITATDASGASASKSYDLTVNPKPLITTTSLPAWTVGQAYNQTIATTGGVAPVTFSYSGNLPTGLSLNSTTGAITGTPTTTAGSPFSFTIFATDIAGTSSSQNYSVAIHAAPGITTTTLSNWTVNRPYSKTIAVSGGTSPVTFAVFAGSLPTGLSLNTSTGAITGTPNTTSGSPFAFTVTATDAAGATASKAYSITINPALNISSANLPTASSGVAYNQTITVSGGTTPYTSVSVTAFNGGTTGLTSSFLSASASAGTITLSGTPTAAGTVTFTANVTDTAGATLSANYSVAVFGIQSVAASPSGVVLTFDAPIDPTTPVLYSSPGDTTLGVANITVVGATTGPVRGSLVIDPTDPDMATFVQTSGLLAADTYTVTVTPGVKAVGGAVLAGTFSTTLTVTTPTTPVLSVPSFARGPGQPVQLTDSLGNTTGIPVSISNATNVTQASFTLTYDPTLLTIGSTAALSASSAATAAGLTSLSYTIMPVDTHHDVLTVNLSGGTGLTATTALPLVTIAATVPTTAPYTDKAVLNLTNVMVNASNATGVSGVDDAAYLGNVTGSGTIGALDASLVDQVGSGAGTGFSAFKDLDPAIIGDVSGGTSVGAQDASLINEAGAGATVFQIPATPSGVSLITGGPDPYFYLAPIQASLGQTVTETLYLDITDPNGIQLAALDEAIGFDTSALQVSNVRSASGLSAIGSYGTVSSIDNASGVLLAGQAFAGSGLPPRVPYGTDVPVLQFDVTLNANLAIGAATAVTLLQDGTINGQTKFTAISDNAGALTWTPGMAPSNSGNAAIDGSVTVVPQAAPIVPDTLVSAPAPPVAALPKVVVPVRRVTPITTMPVHAATPVTSDESLSSPASAETSTPIAETVVASASPLLPAPVAPVQAEASIFANPLTVAPALTTEAMAPRTVDPGAALSLVAVGTNKALPGTTTTTSSVKTATSALDELYRQFGTLLSTPPVNNYNLGVTGDEDTDASPDRFDPDYILADMS